MRISHRNLEVIRKSPQSIKQIIGNNSPRTSMARYWQFAIKKYHKNNDINEAIDYFQSNCQQHFKDTKANQTQIFQLTDKINQYRADYLLLDFEYYDYSQRLSMDINYKNFLSGEIFRIDKKKEGGYAITLFEKDNELWSSELRFPLLQIHYSNIFKCPIDEISVGTYNLKTGKHQYINYDEYSLKTSWEEILNISRIISKA